MGLLFWTIVFVLSLGVLVKGADWFTESAERIGLALGLSSFIVGVLIVGLGTSFPELISSIAAVLKGVGEFPVANAVGSNIANILLIVGISAILARRLVVTRSLIDLDLPLLAGATVLLLVVVWDKRVTFGEAMLLCIVYIVYLLYTLLHQEELTEEVEEVERKTLPSRKDRRKYIISSQKEKVVRPKIGFKDVILLFIGGIFLIFGADYLIESVVHLSQILHIAKEVIAITAVAIGTSLPELVVSATAALKKKSELALGNIFGSNVFNALVVIGLPGLFTTLSVDTQTFLIGIPIMALATLLFVISGISRKIHIWEGAFYLAIYILFLVKLFQWF